MVYAVTMDMRAFRTALEAEGLSRNVSDAIADYVDDQKSDLVTNQKLELELTKLGGELRREMADLKGELKTDFAEHKADMTRLVLGTSGALGVTLGILMVALRFLPN
jgi:hypothetical protein